MWKTQCQTFASGFCSTHLWYVFRMKKLNSFKIHQILKQKSAKNTYKVVPQFVSQVGEHNSNDYGLW